MDLGGTAFSSGEGQVKSRTPKSQGGGSYPLSPPVDTYVGIWLEGNLK